MQHTKHHPSSPSARIIVATAPHALRFRACLSAQQKQASTSAFVPTSAKDAIAKGLTQFHEQKDYADAARLFSVALTMKTSDEEATAALYNLGCAYTKLKQYKPAAEAICKAINEHNLKLSVALKVKPASRHAKECLLVISA